MGSLFVLIRSFPSSLPWFRCFSTSHQLFKTASSNRWLNRQNNDYFTRRAKVENYKSRAAFKLLQIDERFKIFRSKSSSPRNTLNVLDLGAAPGAWNQVALDRSPHGSKILGVDILPYQPPDGASTLQGNILSKGTHQQIKNFFTLSELEKKDEIFNDVEIITSSKSTPEPMESDASILEKEIEVSQLMGKELSNKDNGPAADPASSGSDLTASYPVDVVLSDMMANTTGLALKDHVMSMDLCDAALITAVDLLKKNGSLVMKFFSGEDDVVLEKRLNAVFREVKRFKPKACRLESKECYFVCLGKRAYDVDKVELFSMR
ncbi:hypothetical protein PICMEDRAFT_14250 [Pichia membranifaciens NRRL Y-2026]|uniref:rRNA methyltransferase 2, mitochondrial n=1 Tax=Pichia membranifaciens NRRL Y-2026 TaxID=763406 RepID=A0A1E3NSS0_9ASCO|nr:hypothetical protein PICMEDRAFT_14250 [Pichia membranifaciens NRRL Y-2026]ODQ48718.1 hypothetical protein PICMEDRAFT_14250 [Pichia membranifaciens NRRL Y-2026]